MLKPEFMKDSPLSSLHNEIISLKKSKNFWFIVGRLLLITAAATTAALGMLPPEILPISTNVVGVFAFSSISIYVITEPEKRYIAFKEAHLSLRSEIGKFNMAQIGSDELIDRWSRIDERLHFKVLRS